MDLRDIFVATVAITLGVLMLHSAALNRGWCLEMKVAQAIEAAQGRGRARFFVGSVGALMLVLGLYLLFRPASLLTLLKNPNNSVIGFEVSPSAMQLKPKLRQRLFDSLIKSPTKTDGWGL